MASSSFLTIPEFLLQSIFCCTCFRLLLARSFPATEFNIFPAHFGDEILIVIRALMGNDSVRRAGRSYRLEMLLEFSLGVDLVGFLRNFFDEIPKVPENEFPRFFKSSVEINCAGESFESVGEIRWSAAPTTRGFAFSQYASKTCRCSSSGITVRALLKSQSNSFRKIQRRMRDF